MNEQLRNNELYCMQSFFDNLYADSKNGNNFYHLYETITSRNNILLAYQNLRISNYCATSGVDGKTLMWMEQMTDDSLVAFVRDRLSNYQPNPVKRITISEKSGMLRQIGISTIADRLIQQCFLQVLTPIAEAKFYNHNYGSRPCRSTAHALSRMVSLINVAKLYDCANITVSSVFDEADHGRMMRQLWTFGIRDKRVLAILRKMLKTSFYKNEIPKKGLLQAGDLASLLMNIYLNDLDHWVASQWEYFPVDGDIHNFHRYRARATGLKSGYLVRYNGDVKVLCRSHDDAVRFCYGIRNYISDHLLLPVNDQDLSVVNLKKKSTDFLGFNIKVIEKRSARYGWVARTKMSQTSAMYVSDRLKTAIKKIQYHSFDPRAVQEYNALVLGIKNYYQYATDVYCDLNRIGMSVSLVIKNRLSDRGSYSVCGSQTAEYRKRNKGIRPTTKVMVVCGVPMDIINGIRHRSPMNFSQETTPYTKTGRQRMCRGGVRIREDYLTYIADTAGKQKGSSEYLNNRFSRYILQNGICPVLDIQFHPKNMYCYHVQMKKHDHGSTNDCVQNLVWVHKDVYMLIHATNDQVIRNYCRRLKLTDKQLEKVNQFRKKIGNRVIERDQDY